MHEARNFHLHHIALASLLGLLFRRCVPLLTLIVALAVIAVPFFLRGEAFNHPALWWVGLSSAPPRSNDYVPLFPWFGAVLLGMAAGVAARRAGWLDRLASVAAPRHTWPLIWAGRHSLLVYIVHQPVLIALIWLVSQVAPAPVEPPQVQFLQACAAQCEPTRDADFCSRYCACMVGEIERAGLLGPVMEGTDDASTRTRIGETAFLCAGDAERGGANF